MLFEGLSPRQKSILIREHFLLSSFLALRKFILRMKGKRRENSLPLAAPLEMPFPWKDETRTLMSPVQKKRGEKKGSF